MAKIKIREILEKLKRSKCGKDLIKILNESYLNEILEMPDENDIKSLNKLLVALQNPIRIKILYLLSQAELPVCIITEALGIDQTLVSHHLSILRNAGLVNVRICGKYRFYSIEDKNTVDILMKILRYVQQNA